MNINKRLVAAIAAVVLAALGILSLVAYVNDADDRAFKGTELVPAIRVVSDVPAGTDATKLGDAVEVVQLPKAAVPDTAVTTLDDVAGQVTTSALVPGEVLVTGRFGASADASGESSDGKGVDVPKGMQEITIKIARVRALGGTLKPGDTVGVVASYDAERQSNFAVNKVLVLSNKVVAGAGADGATDEYEVGLAVMSLDAEKIVHASEFGRVYLTLQGDDAEVDRRIVTADGVLK